ncbi:MAG: transglutaminase-like domain-containing protein [Pseudomonadota bacterium]
MTALTECRRSVGGDASVPAWFEIEDHITVTGVAPDSGPVRLWCPLIQDSPYQRVLDIDVESSAGGRIEREPVHGNLLWYAESGDAGSPVEVRIRCLVQRTPVTHVLHPACARPVDNPRLFRRHLEAERFVDVDERIRRVAEAAVGSETNVLSRARRIYDHVVAGMTYDAERQSWKGSTEHALVCSAGNCNDIHALFISMARSLGIPARLVLGQALEPPPPGREACELCGYHCWAEFYAAGLGWVPVDASCACKYGKDQLFGDLELNHVAWSVGRDIRLAPAQAGEPLLFFAGPYAEVSGHPHRQMERRLRHTQI